MKQSHIVPAVLTVAAVALARPAWAGDVTLDFSSLPSAQGWEFYDNDQGVSEASVFAATGSGLTMNFADLEFNTGYGLRMPIDATLPFRLSFRAQVSADARFLSFQVADQDSFANIVFLAGGVHTYRPCCGNYARIVSYDAASVQDYRLERDATQTYNLYVDNQLAFTAASDYFALPPGSFSGPSLYFGSHTTGTAELAAYSFEQSVPVPEPGVAALLSLGLAGLAWRRRHGASAG